MFAKEIQYFRNRRYRRRILNKISEELYLENSDVQALWKRRDRLQIMTEIMEVAKGKQLKTRIMYMVNLSFSQLNEYLSFLTEKGFLRIQIENKKKVYETTTKGNLYIENYTEMSNRLRTQDLAEAQVLLQ